MSARLGWLRFSLLACGLTSLALTGCGKKPRGERPAAPSATVASSAHAPPAVQTPPPRPEPKLLAHISPAWGRHGQLPQDVGIPVGQLIPDVAGVDSEGKEVRLREAAKQHAPLVVIFYRGGFCGFAGYFLRAIAVQDKAFRDSGARFVFISPDTREQVALTKAEHKLDWPMLADPELTVIKAFHLEHTVDDKDIADAAQYKMTLPTRAGGARATLTNPAVFVVDAEGKVKFAHADVRSDRMLAYSQILNGVEQARGAPKPTPP